MLSYINYRFIIGFGSNLIFNFYGVKKDYVIEVWCLKDFLCFGIMI